MLSLPAALESALALRGVSDFAWLVEVRDTTVLYRTNWNEPITFTPDDDGTEHTYTPDAFSFGSIEQNVLGEQPNLTLTIQNVSDPSTGSAVPWSTILAARTLNGTEVRFRLVKVSLVADGTAQVSQVRWHISGPALEGTNAVLRVGPPHDVFRLETPVLPLKGSRCAWTYKDANCRSESVLATCGYTLEDCLKRHDPAKLRFSQLPYHDQSLRRRA